MQNLQMVDLQGQYRKIQKEIDEAVLGVVRSTAYINGPEVKSFQQELEAYLGVSHVIPCANGTDALQIAMMALGLQPGDEVITANFTYVATAEVIALLRLKPVLVDVDPNTFTIDPKAVEAAITSRTKAIVPVHLYGQCADMEAIGAIAERHGLFVIEDTAQAIGANYTFSDGRVKKAGTMGTIGCTSFFPSKNLGCYGDGGALYTDREDLAHKVRQIANHGQSKQYYHDEVGVNSRLDSIQAAILRIKLRHLDTYNSHRAWAASAYTQQLSEVVNLITPALYDRSTHVFHQYTLRVTNGRRDELKAYLAERGIPAMIYYPVPLHLQKAYVDERYGSSAFPVTQELCEQVISLPMHSELTQEIIDHICIHIKTFMQA
ncbi:MAG TPA: DegT/DnrJ/EryC1/StrS family aminotransferase [Luteibaculaceae bacterium]|nr:DegT/DnrJ/EryC1/StrS family aminotransferase [Luteibaculaceae bacterium]